MVRKGTGVKVHRAAAPAEVSGRAGFEYKFWARSLLGVTMSPLCSFYIRGRFVIPTGAAFFCGEVEGST